MNNPVSVYLRLTNYSAAILNASGLFDTGAAIPIKDKLDTSSSQFIKVDSFKTDVVQTLGIGSQSAGAGAGKVTFDPFIVTRLIDPLSPTLFQNAASGTSFKTVEVFFVNPQGFIIAKHLFKLAAIKTIAWSVLPDDSGLVETVGFEYGGLIITVNQQNADGKVNTITAGWNRVKNIKDNDPALVIS